ncbi:MAG: GNAT family N-acetyltransferase [Betaproteobacteria bacterium]|nr:GNAT family N-acetyltransferase [Betaproteobacteria bacterium]
MPDRKEPGWEIRPAQPQDIGVLHALIRGLAEYEKLAHQAVGTPAQLHTELFGPTPVIESVLLWEGERAVGFALWFQNFSTFLGRRGIWLEDIFVLPEARGRGYGKALLRHCARTAVARGCGRFEWSVLDWNQPSIDFYKACGAVLMDDWTTCRMTGIALERFAAEP